MKYSEEFEKWWNENYCTDSVVDEIIKKIAYRSWLASREYLKSTDTPTSIELLF